MNILDNCSYNGNHNLKPAGIKIELTKDQIREIVKCKDDVHYFIEKYMKIVNVDEGLVPFKLREYQKDIINKFMNNRFNVLLTPRQIGKTTCSIAYLMHQVLFTTDATIGILANKATISIEILGKLQLAYEYIPKWLQQGIIKWNAGSIHLENGSRIIASATSSSAIRGYSLTHLFLDEFGHVDANVAVKFFTSVYPTISSGKKTKCIIVSTPNGIGNLFHKIWTDAVNKRNLYVPTMINWWDVPGRDDAWKNEQLQNMSERMFQQEHGNSFLGSSNTLIDGEFLETMTFDVPIFEKEDTYSVYQEPLKGHHYVIVADTSEGNGGDAQAFHVIDITKIPYNQVATFNDNKVQAPMMPTWLHMFARKYNDAYVLIELNGTGESIARNLYYEMEYENIFCTIYKGRAGQFLCLPGTEGKTKFGVTTTKPVKATGCSWAKDLIENKKLHIRDAGTIKQLSTFVSNGITFEATEGNNDDLCSGLVLFGWLVNQRFFKNLFDFGVREQILRDRENTLKEEMDVVGWRFDGLGPMEQESFVEDGDRWFVTSAPIFTGNQQG